jgi:(1->4)-alpha-D-glucan 1-alpha-D-glucosylmutase
VAPLARVATYRLQLHAGFTFADATAVVPYLHRLGISHLYLSPITQAAPGSTHGYDQCDPARVSEDLGGDIGFRRLVAEVRGHRMGIILDVVPNHMATSDANPWWWELLATGREGPAGHLFDVDWSPGDPELDGRVMVPVLGRPLDDVLADGELELAQRDGDTVLRYFEQDFPLSEGPRDLGRALLDRQHYLLAHWREASTRLNYRRFFDVNTLVGLREEDAAVFAAVHDLPLRMLDADEVQGLRIDHVDGLRDPDAYLGALRRRAPRAWLLVEKILEPGERLSAAWPADGTTGYDFIHRLQGIFVDGRAAEELTAFYGDFTGESTDYAAVVHECKLRAATELFGSDVARLERIFAKVCAGRGVDSTPAARMACINQVAACFPVYRTYVRPGNPAPATARVYVKAAIAGARKLDASLDHELLDLLGSVLVLDVDGDDAVELALRFQQLSGPLMAKGAEDTAFYRYNRLTCLNEVGSDPGIFAVAVDAFHAANRETLARHPAAMLASSSHDTKRSEDVRARLSLLAQVPNAWAAAVRRWSAINEKHRRRGWPDRNAEYLLYQTLVGAWPLETARAGAYMEKATREARQHTSWVDPDRAYEEALRAFVEAVAADEEFQADLRAFVDPLVEPGRAVSLAMTLIKLTAPGVPDLYQGTEVWDLSLVDPDNRRPVDYTLRGKLLVEGHPKIHLVTAALRVRRACPQAFNAASTYAPLEPSGSASANVVSFARGTTDDPLMVAVVTPRLSLRDHPDWAETTLELGPGTWTNVLNGGDVTGPRPSLARIFDGSPVALLERER